MRPPLLCLGGCGLRRAALLPRVGHFAHVEAPNKVVELIEDFIATSDRRDVGSPQPGSFSASAEDVTSGTND